MIHNTSSTINDDGSITYRIDDFVNATVAAQMAGGPVLASKIVAFGEQLVVEVTFGLGDKSAVAPAGLHDTIPRPVGVPLFQPDPQVVESAKRNPPDQHPSHFGPEDMTSALIGSPKPLGKPPAPPAPKD